MIRLLLIALLLLPPLRARATDATTYGWRQHPGASLPLQATFTDSTGRNVSLASLIQGRPVILDLGYFHCPSLCGVVRNDLLHAIRGSKLISGRDFDLIALSIDPQETPRDAAEARQADMRQSGQSGRGWHYLTGTAAEIAAVTKTAGFRDKFDSSVKQFLHPTGLVITSGAGIISSYLLGVGFQSGDLRSAILRARSGGIAKAALPVLLLCFHFDSVTGRYTLEIFKVLRLAGYLTVVTLAMLLWVLHRKERQKKEHRG